MTEQKHSACPFCGGEVDPTGWLRGDGLRGPECDGCGATAPSMEVWEQRASLAQPSPAPELEQPEVVGKVAFVLRQIGSLDAEDIDGDNVDLRFEDAEGRDTGCDVSIVEYAEKAADLLEQHDRIVGALRAQRSAVTPRMVGKACSMVNPFIPYEEMEAALKAAQSAAQPLTYFSDQATECAGCGKRKHTPLRVDWMGGYVCLTCMDEKLEALHDVAQAGQVPQALLDVQAERRRQVETEGFDASHDNMATKGQIARAAGCYALHAGGIGTDWPTGIRNGSALFWPWDEEWWKPKPPRENLVRAGAMIIAEIERLDRAAAPAQGGRDE